MVEGLGDEVHGSGLEGLELVLDGVEGGYEDDGDVLEAVVQLLALGEELVQGGLPEDRPQRRLGQLLGGIEVVRHLHDRLRRVHDVEVDDRVDLDGDVVPRDHVLRGHLQGDGAQVLGNEGEGFGDGA